MKKNKKGFTLVELLAVIVILGVLLIIAVPAVTRLISSSRQGAADDQALMVLKSLELCNTNELKSCSSTDLAKYYEGDTNDVTITYDANGKMTVFQVDFNGYTVKVTGSNLSVLSIKNAINGTTSDWAEGAKTRNITLS